MALCKCFPGFLNMELGMGRFRRLLLSCMQAGICGILESRRDSAGLGSITQGVQVPTV